MFEDFKCSLVNNLDIIKDIKVIKRLVYVIKMFKSSEGNGRVEKN